MDICKSLSPWLSGWFLGLVLGIYSCCFSCTCVGGEESFFAIIMSGVLQGCPLSGTLFAVALDIYRCIYIYVYIHIGSISLSQRFDMDYYSPKGRRALGWGPAGEQKGHIVAVGSHDGPLQRAQ